MIVPTASPPPRRGLTAVAVLVCLIIITMISGAVIRVGLRVGMKCGPRNEASRPSGSPRREFSGAVARLASDRAYIGETWDIPARELDSADAALVTITIAPRPAIRSGYKSAPGRIIPATRPAGRDTPGR